MKYILETKGITKIYKRGNAETVYALNNVNFKLGENELVIVMGSSGSGKSTLLNLLGGLDVPTNGEILFEGVDITKFNEREATIYRREKVGFVFQNWQLIPHLTAVENVEIPLYPTKVPSDEIRGRAMRLLRQVELYDREHHRPDQMSGGEQQRVGIARALISEPKILLADEPTGNLDTKTGELIMRLLKRVTRSGTSTVVATHDESLRKFADRVIRLQDGEIVLR